MHHHVGSASSSFCNTEDVRFGGTGSRSACLLPSHYCRLYLPLRKALLLKIVFSITSLLAVVLVKGNNKEELLYFRCFWIEWEIVIQIPFDAQSAHYFFSCSRFFCFLFFFIACVLSPATHPPQVSKWAQFPHLDGTALSARSFLSLWPPWLSSWTRSRSASAISLGVSRRVLCTVGNQWMEPA